MSNEMNEKNLSEQPEETVALPVEEPVAQPATLDDAPEIETEEEDLAAEEVMNALAGKKTKTPNRRLRYGSLAAAVTALVVVGAVVVGILADVLFARFPLSIDMTEEDIFSLSEESVEVIEAIDKPVEIVAFFTEDAISKPTTTLTELNTVYKELHKALGEYASRSKGQVTVRYIDLATQPTLQSEFKSYGDMAEGNILFRCGEGNDEKYRVKTINDFYTYSSEDGYTLSSFTSRVEITLASTVNAVITGTQQELMLVTGHEEDEYVVTALKDLYELNGYVVNEVNLATDQEIGENVTTAIVAAPLTDLSNAEVTRLRDWLTNSGKLGRNLMVVVNSMATKADTPNLYEFLDDEYGIEVTDNLVMESAADRMVAGYNGQMIYADLPESPLQESGDKAAALMAYLPRQILLKAGTDNSKELYNIPLVTFPETARLLALPVNDDSELTEADEYPVTGMGMSVKWTYDNNTENADVVQTAVVVANQGMIESTLFAAPSIENERVALDVMNYINGNEENVSISDKDVTQKALNFSAGTVMALGIILTVVLPLALLAICIAVFLRRKHL